MRRITSSLLFLLFCCCCKSLFAQTKQIDSLHSVLKTAKEDISKVNTLNALSTQLQQIANYSVAKKYADDALVLSQKLNFKKGIANASSIIGNIYWDQGYYAEAIKNLLTSLKIWEETGDKQGMADSYNNIGDMYNKKNENDKAIKNYQASLKISEEIGDKQGMAASYNNLGNCYYDQENYPEAIKNFFAELKISEEIGDKKRIAASYNGIGKAYMNQDNYSEALKNFSAELKISEEIGYKKGISASYNNIGIISEDKGNYAEALKNYLASLKICEEIGDKQSMVNRYFNIGWVYGYLLNYPEELKSFLAALKICEEMGSKRGIGNCYLNIGGIYFDHGNYPEALKNYLAFLKISEEIGNQAGVAASYNNIGSIYGKQGNYPEAMKNYLASLKISEEIKNKPGTAEAYENVGEVYMDQGNYPEALKSYLASLKLWEEIGDKQKTIDSYVAIGKEYTELKNNAEAKKYLNDALSLSKEIGSKEKITKSYGELTNLDSAAGNWEGAYRNHQLFILYRDSLVNEENTKKTVKVQMQYEFDKKEDSLKYQQTVTDEKLKQQTLLTQQNQQSLLLKEKELALTGKEKELQHLAYLKSESDFEAEQSKGSEKQKQLTIINQRSALLAGQLKLGQTQLNLKENQLQSQRSQKFFYIGGIALMLLLFLLIFRNIKTRQKANAIITAERLRTEKASAAHKMTELELQSLRTQLNPHFMFNSLNAIQELIVMEENELSQSYLERFALLLRMLLENADQPFIPLRKEIDFLELYLSLERLRIPDLQYSIEVAPQLNVEKTMIPNMILQPYIENALWHGLQNKQGEKKLELYIYTQNGLLHYEIKDNGVGRKKAAELKSLYRKKHNSKGMELLSKRFSLLSKEYGQDIQTSVSDVVENSDVAGTLVKITIPSNLSEPAKTAFL